MNHRTLGRTGLVGSEIALGTWALGSAVYGEVETRDATALIQGALDRGINVFDTAPLYGNATEDGVAERVLGDALGSARDRVIIATKFGRSATRPMPPHFNAAGARASVEASLRRLRRDHIDILFFHSPFSPAEIADNVWSELDRLRHEGKVRHIGHSVSEFKATEEMCRWWIRDRRIDVIQVVLSLFNREARTLVNQAAANGVAVFARECLANGLLSGAIRSDTVFRAGTVNSRYSPAEIAERAGYAEALRAKAVREDLRSLPQAAYRWVLDQRGVSLALSGARTLAELDDAIEGSQARRYSDAELQSLEQLHARDYSAA